MSKTVTMPLNDADKLYAYAERDKQTKKNSHVYREAARSPRG
jgi:hypothetical protein